MGTQDDEVITGSGRVVHSDTGSCTVDEGNIIDDDRSLKPVDPDLVYGAGAGSRSDHADDDLLKVWRFQQSRLIPDVIPPIDRRKFDYTPWESQYMWDEGFASVIDESNRVVGHVGYVYLSDIWISLEDRRALGKPDHEPPTLIGWDKEQAYAKVASQMNKDIESGVRVYVDDGKSIDKNRFIIWSYDQMPNYGRTAAAVIVDPNGQIIKILEVIYIEISRLQRALQGLMTALNVLAVIDLAGLVIDLALIPVARIGALGLRSGGRLIWGLALRVLRREAKEVLVLTAEERTALALIRKQFPQLAKLTDREIISIRRYSDNAWADVNAALRGVSNPDQITNELAKNVVSGLKKLPGYTGELTRSEARAIEEAVKEYKKGSEVVMKGLTSTSRAGAVAQREGNIAITIKAVGKNGKDIAEMAKHAGHETEVLFLPGTRFVVEDATRIKDALLVVLREL
jgi:hypothetical protein